MNFIKRLISHHINTKITEENIDENTKKRCHQNLEENNSALNSRSVNVTLVGNNASLDTATNKSKSLNNVTDDIKENTNISQVSRANDFDVSNVSDFETTEAQNNSFEADCFDNIIDFSQMTSDASLNNIILDNLSDSSEIEEDINGSLLEPENQVNEVILQENNTDNNIILDDFEKLLDEEIKKRDIKDVIKKLVLVTKNDCDNSLNIQQDDKTNEGDQTTIHFIEIEGNLFIDNISNNLKVVDDITISSEEDSNLLSDLEIISISSQEENPQNNFTDNVNTKSESDLKSNNSTEKKIDETLQTNEINVDNINDNKIISLIDENSCSSYHSSDFEFITEEEAHKDCLINTDKKFNGTLKTIKISQDSGFNDFESSSQNSAGPSCQSDMRNREITDYRNAVARYQNYNFDMRDVTDMSYRRNHVVPEGDGYLNLFQGIHSPTVPYMMENKSTRSPSVYVQCEGIGFDMRAVGARNSDDEFAEEAEESSKIILTMYPAENKRKRRRF